MSLLDSPKFYYQIAILTTIVVFIEIVLGSYVKSIEAGLSCPDWPLCYGQLIPLDSSVTNDYSMVQIWSEYIHRVNATLVSFLLVFLAFLTYKHKDEITSNKISIGKKRFQIMSIIILLLIIQIIFGALTVLLLTDPLIVSSHLAFATLIFGATIFLVTKISPQQIYT